MARTYITGGELGAAGEFWTDQCAYSTTHKRSGSFGMLFTTVGSSISNTQFKRLAGASFPTFARSARFYVKLITSFSATSRIFFNESTTPTIFDQLSLNSNGTLTVTDGTNAATSVSALTVDGLWHRVEFDVGWSSGNGRRVFVDGVQWASTAVGASVVHEGFVWGIFDSILTGSIAFDDILIDDASFVTSGFPGDGTCTLLPATSDNAVNNWVAGAGATTNEFDAVDNIPPVGVVLASATNTSQIKNTTSGTTEDAVFNCQDYTSAGIAGTVNVVMPIVNHGNGSTTSLSGGIWASSNPTQSAPGTTFNYGNGTVAAGTFPSNWKTQFGPTSIAPSPTLGNSPVVTVRKSTANVAAAMVDFVGVYVDWSPPDMRWLGSYPDVLFDRVGVVPSGVI